MPAARPRRRVAILGACLVIAATIIAYYPALRGGLLWDDDRHLTSASRAGLDGLIRTWLKVGFTQQYYPVAHSAFWLMNRLWGHQTLGYHLVNVLLHAGSALLLWRILHQLGLHGGFPAALLFALHPVNVESVAWMTELKNTLSTTLGLAAVLAYLHFDRSRAKAAYALAVVLFLAALGAKTVTAVLPAAIMVILWWQRGKLSLRRDVLPLAPFFVLALIGGLTTAWVERHFIGARGSEYHFTLADRILIAGRAVWFYLSKLAWPWKLTFIYPRWQIDAGQWWQWLFPAAAALVLGLLWIMRRRIGRAPLAVALLYVGLLFPALGFFNVYPMRYSFVADHFQYLASAAMLGGVAAAVASLLRKGYSQMRTAYAICGLVALGLSIATWRQARLYRNAETLWTATIERNPTCTMAYDNRGNVRTAAGRYKDAIEDYTRVIQDTPDYAIAWNNRGNAFYFIGKPEEALRDLGRAAALDPKMPDPWVNQGNVLTLLGRYEQAIAAFTRAIELEPKLAMAWSKRGNAKSLLGRQQEALQDYDQALRLDPSSAEFHYNCGRAYHLMGQDREALREYDRAIAADPRLLPAYLNRGTLHYEHQRFEPAIWDFSAALRVANSTEQPAPAASALYMMARCQAAGGHWWQAWDCLAKCQQLGGSPDPQFVQTVRQHMDASR